MTNTSSSIVVFTTLLLALGVVAGHFFGDPFVALFNNVTSKETAPAEQQVVSNQLPGSFLVSMRPLSPEGSKAAIYKISAANGDTTLENDAADYYAPIFSNEGSQIAVVSSEGTENALLFVSTITQPENAVGFAPPAPALWAGPANWSSDDTHIIYEAVTAPKNEVDTSVENGRIVLLNVETKQQQIIGTGVSPIFTPDDSVLYLRGDGVYRQRIASSTPDGDPVRLAFFDGYSATMYSQIALSPDGARLIVTHPELPLMMSYAVYGNDQGVELAEDRSIAVSARWPVFSPDGETLAFIERFETESGDIKKAIVSMDLATGDIRGDTPLDQYDDMYLSLREWLQ